MASPERVSERPLRLSWDISTKTDPDALDAYRAGMSDLYDTSNFADGRPAFFNRTATWQFGSTVFGRSESNGQTLSRSEVEIRRSGFDGICMFLDRAGLAADMDGRRVVAGPNAIHFRDLTRASISHLIRIDMVVTIIPRELAPEWLLDPRIHGHCIDGGSTTGRMLAAHLVSTVGMADELDHEGGSAAVEAAFMLARQSIGRTGVLTANQANAAYRTVRHLAIAMIERELLSRDLTPDRIAAALGVSRSTLYRAFEAAGGVIASIQRRRLSHAYALLRQRPGRTPTVADIAFSCGFASESHFSRVFRDRFDIAPGDLGVGRADLKPRSTGEHRHDVCMDWLRSQ